MSDGTTTEKAPDPATDAAPSSAPVEKKINWGGVVKGALIVTAAVVACGAVIWLGSAAAGALLSDATIGGFWSSAVSGIGTILHGSMVALGELSAHLGITGFFTQTLGFNTANSVFIKGVTSTLAGWGAGLSAAIVGAPLALKAAMTSVTAPMDPSSHGMVDDGSHTMAASKANMADVGGAEHAHSDLSLKAGQHAAEHGEDQASDAPHDASHDAPHTHDKPHPSWTARFASRSAAATITPRDASFAAQAAAEQAAAADKKAAMA